jgi:hypothetical protein
MTSKIYKTAKGKAIDLGTIRLQNEHVRAVGNMNVNARGDKLDQNNRVVETKAQQIQKQNARGTNVSDAPVHTSVNKATKRAKKAQDDGTPVANTTPAVTTTPPASGSTQTSANSSKVPEGGLAGAIARQREVKQELEKTQRQQQQAQGLRKI